MVDTLIRLFYATDEEFTTNGIGILADAISCNVIEERNGEFELELKYPVNGSHYDDIKLRNILVVKPNPFDDPQAFRIYEITKPINGIIEISAAHISYDLSGYPLIPFSANGILPALSGLISNCPIRCPFSFYTDRTTTSKFSVNTPSSIRSVLGGTEGSIIDVYGGEFEFNNFNITLHLYRGIDRGVTIEYGKNLTEFSQEENSDNIYTGIYPYWYSEIQNGDNTEKVLVTLPEKIVNCEGTYDYDKILTIDFTSDFNEEPTYDQLRQRAKKYIEDNDIGVPKINIEISFLQLENTTEYEKYKLLETVRLCDTVTVKFPLFKVESQYKCIKTEYDVLTGQYISIELGSNSTDLAESISEQSKTIKEMPTMSIINKAIDRATSLITGGSGGYVVINSSTNGTEPDEILVMDSPNIETSSKIWRWNKNGLGFSKNGYNGPYEVAMTINGEIVADFISTGFLQADRLQVGSIESKYLSSDISNFIQNGSLWLDFDASSDGLVIGRNGSEFKVAISNNSIEFRSGNSVLTKITQDNISIKDAEINNTLTIKKTSLNSAFSFIPRSNGTLDFKFTGSEIET